MNAIQASERPRRLAAPAPDREPRTKPSDGLESEVHTLCVEWVQWCQTRGRLGAPRPPGSILAQLLRVPSSAGDERSGRFSRDIAQFNYCIVHADDQIARAVFEAHFLKRDRHVKRLAYEYGISRATWYRTVNTFARTAYRRFMAMTEERMQA